MVFSLQVSSQTGEDSTGRDTQTDDVVMVNRWVQWPPEDLRGWGCDDGDDNDDVMTTNTLLSDKESMGLSKFLQNAGQVSIYVLVIMVYKIMVRFNKCFIVFCTTDV